MKSHHKPTSVCKQSRHLEHRTVMHYWPCFRRAARPRTASQVRGASLFPRHEHLRPRCQRVKHTPCTTPPTPRQSRPSTHSHTRSSHHTKRITQSTHVAHTQTHSTRFLGQSLGNSCSLLYLVRRCAIWCGAWGPARARRTTVRLRLHRGRSGTGGMGGGIGSGEGCSWLAAPEVARVQTAVAHRVLLAQPGEEALEAQAVAAVRGGSVSAGGVSGVFLL